MSLHADAKPFVPPAVTAAEMAKPTTATATTTTATTATATAKAKAKTARTKPARTKARTTRHGMVAESKSGPENGAGDGRKSRDEKNRRGPGAGKGRENRDGNRGEARPSKGSAHRGKANADDVDSEERPDRGERRDGGKNGKKKAKQQQRLRKPKNTTDFTPRFDKPDLRFKVLTGPRKLKNLTVHDVVFAPDLFCDEDDLTVFEALKKEIHEAQGNEALFTLWHGDTHEIANDKFQRGEWKKKSPTFNAVIRKIEETFNMKINATRFNLYRKGSTDWKPFHHDRAAFTPDCPQNFTVAASFGLSREIGFEHARNKTKLFLEAPNGSAYTFSRDVNIEFKHGVIPLHEPASDDRISIIAWGLSNMSADGSRVTENDVPSAEDLGLARPSPPT